LPIFQVLESIPQIPIHVNEIKKLILKDNPGYTVESNLNEARLLSVLTHGSTGRNPTFFKAFGHEDVFGLKSAIPEGCSTMEIVEDVPKLEPDELEQKTMESNVLYVKLPEGHPVITSTENAAEQSPPHLSMEDAIEQAELIFDDDEALCSNPPEAPEVVEPPPAPSEPKQELEDEVVVEADQPLILKKEEPPPEKQENITASSSTSVSEPMAVDVTSTSLSSKRSSPRISPRLAAAAKLPPTPKDNVNDEVEIIEETSCSQDLVRTTTSTNSDAEIAEALAKSHMHNLRPKRTLRHVQALKQQAKRRKRNTSLASNNYLSPSGLQRVSSSVSSKKSTFASNGDIEIHYKPSMSEMRHAPHSMKDVLNYIPGFSMAKLRKKMPKKLSVSAAIQMATEGSIDLDSPDSILGQVNPRSLLNKSTFLKLPPEYQYKLMQLLPQVDMSVDPESRSVRLNHSSLHNEFFTKACQEWKERLLRGDFTPDTLQRAKADTERDKLKLDPWKAKHFEPVWGVKKDYSLCDNLPEIEPVLTRPRRNKTTKIHHHEEEVDGARIPDEDEPLLKRLKSKQEISCEEEANDVLVSLSTEEQQHSEGTKTIFFFFKNI
jgi:hypothetical protein